MADSDDDRPDSDDLNADDVNAKRRAVLKSALLLPYVVPTLTTIAILASPASAQPPVSNLNEEDPPPPANEPDVNV